MPTSHPLVRALDLIKDYLGVATLLATAVFVVRVLFVARFDPEVATALLLNTQLSTLLLTLALQFIPLALLAGSGVCLLACGRAWSDGRRGRAAGLLIAALVLALVPIMQTDVVTVIAMASSQFGFLVVHGMHREDTSLLYRGFAGLVVLMFVFVAVARPAMWLPSENLEYRGSTRTVYVLSETNTDLVVFSPDDRAVERWAAKDVAARQFCIGPRQASIAEGLFGRPRGVAACVDRG